MSKRIQYFDDLRIVAIIMAIVIHVSMTWWGVTPLNSSGYIFANFFNSLSRCGVPIMVMLSGALLIHPERNEQFKSIKKRVKRIIQAFLFWSSLYALEFILCEEYSSIWPIEFVKQTLMGHYHLWFCFMIVGLYLIHPFINAICKFQENRKYFLVLWCVCAIVVPTVLQIPQFSKMQIILDKFHLFLPLGYSGYWILGYELSVCNFVDKKYIRRLGIVFYTTGAMITFFCSLFISYKTHRENALMLGYFTPNVLLEAIGLWLVFQSLNIEHKNFSVLSKNCFGIYLVSDFGVLLLKHLSEKVDWIMDTPYLIPIYAVIIFSICAGIIRGVRKIPILGENVL